MKGIKEQKEIGDFFPLTCGGGGLGRRGKSREGKILYWQ